eukprot:gb/GFBE01048068.1/.p1 GENE.gb/GFBE01048068.1/~~gb/GFBE01048068.1/.p1  ORF type:complete len:263 (+),score=68.25 gb/GFBE01048068.1/:1-789(+)
MPPVPSLAMSSPHGLGATTPRGAPMSGRSMPGSRPTTGNGAMSGTNPGAFSLSARHIIAPQVGMSAMVSALGNLKAPWEQGKITPLNSARGEDAAPRPYFVGRARAKEQLNMAFSTQDEAARLRRLEQAIDTPAVRFDEALTPRYLQASRQAQVLSKTLNAQERRQAQKEAERAEQQKVAAAPAPPPAPAPAAEAAAEEAAEELQYDEEEAAAALRIQSLYRGKKERQEVQQMVEEETKAATKIQSVYRGKASRKGGEQSEP